MSYRVPPHVLYRELGAEAVLMNLRTGDFYSLNSSGKEMWRLLASGHSPADVVTAITREYRVPAATVQADLQRLLAELRAQSLVDQHE